MIRKQEVRLGWLGWPAGDATPKQVGCGTGRIGASSCQTERLKRSLPPQNGPKLQPVVVLVGQALDGLAVVGATAPKQTYLARSQPETRLLKMTTDIASKGYRCLGCYEPTLRR